MVKQCSNPCYFFLSTQLLFPGIYCFVVFGCCYFFFFCLFFYVLLTNFTQILLTSVLFCFTYIQMYQVLCQLYLPEETTWRISRHAPSEIGCSRAWWTFLLLDTPSPLIAWFSYSLHCTPSSVLADSIIGEHIFQQLPEKECMGCKFFETRFPENIFIHPHTRLKEGHGLLPHSFWCWC